MTISSEVVKILGIVPKKVWIESDILGDRHVMVQHEGHEPFTYASFHYDHHYTSNGGTWQAAEKLALALGASIPVENRERSSSLSLFKVTPKNSDAEIAANSETTQAKTLMDTSVPVEAFLSIMEAMGYHNSIESLELSHEQWAAHLFEHYQKTKSQAAQTTQLTPAQILDLAPKAQAFFARNFGGAPGHWTNEQVRTCELFQQYVTEIVRATEAHHSIIEK